MSRWKAFQRSQIEKALGNAYEADVVQQDIPSAGRVHGTLYYKRNTPRRFGVLLVHGIPGNRYTIGLLGRRLASYGFFCLSIDIPSHYLNMSSFSLGELSETITEAVVLLKRQFSVQRVAVIAHSVGAVGALLSSAGYNPQVEESVYKLWEYVLEMMERIEKVTKQTPNADLKPFLVKVEEAYTQLKGVMFYSLRRGVMESADVTAYVLIEPPRSIKSVVPGLRVLRKLRVPLSKPVIGLLHRFMAADAQRRGNPAYYDKNKEVKGYSHVFFLQVPDMYEFVDHILQMKEATDFLKLMEDIAQFRHRDDKVNFFEYYLKKHVWAKPKLFIYGRYSWFLRPWLGKNKERLETFYRSCGNAQLYYGAFSHLVMENPKQQTAGLSIEDRGTTELIIRFLQNTGMNAETAQSFFGRFRRM